MIALSRKTARQPVTSRERSGHELIVTPRDDRSRSRADAARWEYVAPVWPTLRNSATLPGKIFNWFPAPWQWAATLALAITAGLLSLLGTVGEVALGVLLVVVVFSCLKGFGESPVVREMEESRPPDE